MCVIILGPIVYIKHRIAKHVFRRDQDVHKMFCPENLGFQTRREGRREKEGENRVEISHVAFPLQCLRVPRYPDAGKNSTKRVIVTPLLMCIKR